MIHEPDLPAMPDLDSTPPELSALREIVGQFAREEDADAKTIDVVAQALLRKNALESIDLSLFCLNTLMALARKCDENKRRIIFEASLLDAIVEAMRTHCGGSTKTQTRAPGSLWKFAEIQTRACGLLWSLSVNQDGCKRIAQGGGCEAILNAMLTHMGVDAVQVMALGALKALSFDAIGKSTLHSMGVSSVVADSMQKHLHNQAMQSDGCVILGNLLLNEANRPVAPVGHQEVDAVIMGILAHPDSLEVHEAASFTLMSLTSSPQNVELIRQNSMSREALELVFQKHPEDVGVSILALLRILKFDSPRIEGRHGDLESVNDSDVTHVEQSDTVGSEHGIQRLETLIGARESRMEKEAEEEESAPSQSPRGDKSTYSSSDTVRKQLKDGDLLESDTPAVGETMADLQTKSAHNEIEEQEKDEDSECTEANEYNIFGEPVVSQRKKLVPGTGREPARGGSTPTPNDGNSNAFDRFLERKLAEQDRLVKGQAARAGDVNIAVGAELPHPQPFVNDGFPALAMPSTTVMYALPAEAPGTPTEEHMTSPPRPYGLPAAHSTLDEFEGSTGSDGYREGYSVPLQTAGPPSIGTNPSQSTLLELCYEAVYPDFEPDESKRSESWEPVREWLASNTSSRSNTSRQYQIASLQEKDNQGRTPLHIACCKKAPVDIVKLMLENDAEAVAARTKDKEGDASNMIPLHWACSVCCSPEVILLLFEAFPGGALEKCVDGTTPFKLAPPCATEELVRFILESDMEKLGLLKDFMSPDIFQEAVLKNMHLPSCISWLNMMSCSRRVVFHMMLEFYLHIALILSFVQASKLHLSEKDPSSAWAIAILPTSGMLCLLEVWQLWGYLYIGQPSGYFLDMWNWIDITTHSLSITSAVKLLTEKPVMASMDEATDTRMLLTMTGFFICICFVSYLRKTFFPFASFVGGIVNIIWVLTPFLVVSFLLLGAFAFGYFVQNSEEEYESLEHSFLSIFSLFVGGEQEAETSLDVVFGSIIIIILLNVVIAVVGQAWTEATKMSKEVYWRYRLRFIIEVTRGGRNENRCCGNMLGLRKILDEDWNTTNLKHYLGFTTGRQRRMRRKGNFLLVGGTLFLLCCFTILGFVSFGLLWPMFVLECLFTSKGASNGQVEKEMNAIEKLVSENSKQSEQIEKLTAQMELLCRNMQVVANQTTSGEETGALVAGPTGGQEAEVLVAEPPSDGEAPPLLSQRWIRTEEGIEAKTPIPVAIPWSTPDNMISSIRNPSQPQDTLPTMTAVCSPIEQHQPSAMDNDDQFSIDLNGHSADATQTPVAVSTGMHLDESPELTLYGSVMVANNPDQSRRKHVQNHLQNMPFGVPDFVDIDRSGDNDDMSQVTPITV